MPSYLFYDLETTGLNPAFDQILRFAAIQTDESLVEVDRFEISVKLRPDIIPAPYALLTNRLALEEIQSGLCEYEAVQQIHALFNTPGTISIGYNTLGFDDEFLRFCFYRNLLPPYTHQYRDGCRRMDMLPITTLYFLYKPGDIVWPQKDGKPSLKLENLQRANRLAEGAAHDAMVDVEATVALARRLRQESKMWAFVSGYFDKITDQARCHQCPVVHHTPSGEHRLALMVGSQYGSENHFQIPVLSIGHSIPYANQSLWLRMDLPDLQHFSGSNVEETTWVIRKRMGEPDIVLPPLERYREKLSPEAQTYLRRNQQWLSDHPQRFQEIIAYHQHYRYPEVPDVDADAALYLAGFMSAADDALCRQFHQAPLSAKDRLIPQFGSPVTRRLAERLLFRNYGEQLPGARTREIRRYMAQINPVDKSPALQDYKGQPRRTPGSTLREIEKIKQEENLDRQQQVIVDQLEAYLKAFPQNTS